MSMTAHQEEVMGKVIACLESGQKRIILKGSAGVGKTFVARELVVWYLKSAMFTRSRWSNECIYVTAPTNKALAILQEKMPRDTDKITFKTVHAALKLRRDINTRTGEVKFVPDFSQAKNPPFEGCKAALLDECSMLSTALLDLLDDYQFPIIFLGDDKQLNPVGEPHSPVFNRGYPEFELTEIVRQGAGNPIIELSRNLSLIHKREPKIIEEVGYMYNNNKQLIIDNLAGVNGTDEMKYLSWANFDVDAMNTSVRKRLYGDRPAKVEFGEILVFNAPYGDIYTNKEIKVEELRIITEEINVPTSFSKFNRGDGIPTAMDTIKMKVYRVNDTFNIVHEHSEQMYNIILKTIETNCRKFGWNWKGKFYFAEQFADVKYNHAITIHKSQGSTYGDTILNVGNVMANKNVEERARLLYTGVTRASKVLLLNNV